MPEFRYTRCCNTWLPPPSPVWSAVVPTEMNVVTYPPVETCRTSTLDSTRKRRPLLRPRTRSGSSRRPYHLQGCCAMDVRTKQSEKGLSERLCTRKVSAKHCSGYLLSSANIFTAISHLLAFSYIRQDQSCIDQGVHGLNIQIRDRESQAQYKSDFKCVLGYCSLALVTMYPTERTWVTVAINDLGVRTKIQPLHGIPT